MRASGVEIVGCARHLFLKFNHFNPNMELIPTWQNQHNAIRARRPLLWLAALSATSHLSSGINLQQSGATVSSANHPANIAPTHPHSDAQWGTHTSSTIAYSSEHTIKRTLSLPNPKKYLCVCCLALFTRDFSECWRYSASLIFSRVRS